MDKKRHYRFGYFILMILLGFVIWSTVIHLNIRRDVEDITDGIRHGFEERGFEITDKKWEIYLNSAPDEKLKIYNEWRRGANEIP